MHIDVCIVLKHCLNYFLLFEVKSIVFTFVLNVHILKLSTEEYYYY